MLCAPAPKELPIATTTDGATGMAAAAEQEEEPEAQNWPTAEDGMWGGSGSAPVVLGR